MKLDLGVE